MTNGDGAAASSRIEGMRDMEPEARRAVVARMAVIGASSSEALSCAAVLGLDVANGMIENVIGTFELPLAWRRISQLTGATILCRWR